MGKQKGTQQYNAKNIKTTSKRACTNEKKTKSPDVLDSYIRSNPRWTFSCIDNESWTIRDDFKDKILDKLISFERMTWIDIFQVKRNGVSSRNTAHHFIKTEAIIGEAQSRLDQLKIYVDELFSLSLSNRERLWGILDSGTFRIIWYDRDHEIYPTKK